MDAKISAAIDQILFDLKNSKKVSKQEVERVANIYAVEKNDLPELLKVISKMNIEIIGESKILQKITKYLNE